jgi:hypothetical protein
VTQVAKSDMRQLCTLQEGREEPLPEIGEVDEFPAFARKHKVLILIETTLRYTPHESRRGPSLWKM